MGTWIAGTVVVLMVAVAIGSMIKDKKNGKSLQCGCDCKNCGGHCHK
ncbi:MAG: FeoB-associated Cys-rich membrane protein [Lachnospiraceae bacterium]|nr:FeoB-associated Cys-rich membrane protein [Lachnospiraceae bacterium]